MTLKRMTKQMEAAETRTTFHVCNTQVYRRTQWAETKTGTHMNKDSSPISAFMFLFYEIMQLLVEKTNRYYHQYLEILDEECSPLPDATIQEMYLF
jgi:hypothetical protein